MSSAYIYSAVLQIICEISYISMYSNRDFTLLEAIDKGNNFSRIITYIDTHLYNDVSLKAVSESVFLSQKCVQETVKRNVGMTFHKFILHRKLKDAKEMLTYSPASAQEISRTLGFEAYSTFFREFKKAYGMSPQQLFRKISKSRILSFSKSQVC